MPKSQFKALSNNSLMHKIRTGEVMTLKEIVEQLELCGFECEAGPLENNVAFIELKEMANNLDE